jgi:glycosyltransferase involved in cell wall biosynthesis
MLCQEYEYFRFDACVALGCLLRLPVLATFQGADWEPNPLGRAVRRWTVSASGGLIAAPRAEIGRVQQYYRLSPRRITQVFNPVDLSVWHPPALGESAAQSPARTVVWHGRVARDQKGLDILLDAWDRVARARPGRDLWLRLLGTGPDADWLSGRLAALPRANVEWRNEYVTDRATIRRFLGQGDVFAFPSRYEGFAVAPVEAMACGLPVVAADASGIPDIFVDGDRSGGLVVARDDAPALADALGRLLDDDEYRRELGRRARRRVEDAFSLQAVSRQLHAALLAAGASPDSVTTR